MINILLLRSHQASQQTNFGHVGGVPQSQVHLRFVGCISPHLPRLQVIEIEVRKNFDHQSGIDVEEKILFRVESHIFASEEFKSKLF